MNNKIVYGLILLMSIGWLSGTSLAQTNPSPVGSEQSPIGLGAGSGEMLPASDAPVEVKVVATVNLYQAKLVSQNGNQLRVSFDLYNREGTQAGIKYGINLVRIVDDKASLFDERVYEEIVSLVAGERINRVVEYQAPEFAKGTYDVWVIAKSENGLPLGRGRAGQVTLEGNNEFAEIVTDSCYLKIENESPEKRYTPAQGVDIAKEEKLLAYCEIKNHYSAAVSLVPRFATYHRTTFGKLLDEETGAAIILGPEESKQLSFALPKQDEPQAYDVVLSFITKDNKTISNPAVFHYVVQGQSSTIQNLVLDKDYYSQGDTAIATFTWTGSADTFMGSRSGGTRDAQAKVFIGMTNSLGQACIDSYQQNIDKTKSNVVIQLPIIADCPDPKVAASLRDHQNKALSDAVYEIKSAKKSIDKVKQQKDGQMKGAYFLAIVTLAVLIVLGFFFLLVRARRRAKFPISLFLLLMAAGLFMRGGDAKADTFSVCVEIVWEGHTICAETGTFTVNLDNNNYAPNATIKAYGQGDIALCSNASALSSLDAKINGITQVFFSKNQAGAYTTSLIEKTFTAPSTSGNYGALFTGVAGGGSGSYTIPYSVAKNETVTIQSRSNGVNISGYGGSGVFSVSSTNYNFSFNNGSYTNTTNYVSSGSSTVSYSASDTISANGRIYYRNSSNPQSCSLTDGGSCTVSADYVYNDAACVSIDAPNSVSAGEKFNATVKMKNSGNKTWSNDSTPHRLGQQGSTNWGLGRVDLSGSTSPNQEASFSFQATAPSSTGSYNFTWQMVEETLEWFGPQCTKAISVVNPSYQLSVTKNGSGSGTVTSSPGGISCPGDCTEAYNSGTVVTLTATKEAGSDFVGWGGACSGTNTTCTVTMSQAKDVTATFNLQTNNSSCAWVTAPPASVTQGQAFTAKLRMTNTGSTTWKYNGSNLYNLISYKSSTNSYNGAYWGSGTSDILMNSNVSPGASYEFTINAVAPATATGSQEFDWRMIQQSVEYFGETCVADIMVNPSPPTLNLTADAYSVLYNGSTTLRWTTTNATSCWASGDWTGWKTNTGGSEGTGALTSTKTYNMECWNSVGATTGIKSVIVTVGSATNNADCISISPNKGSYLPNEALTATVVMNNNGSKTWESSDGTPHRLGWDSGASVCSNISACPPYNGQVGDPNFFGRYDSGTVNPGSNKTFTISDTAPGSAGSYPMRWQMVEDGIGWFGEICETTINVAAVPTYALSVSKAGTGTGTVMSSDSKINCGSDCSESGYSSGTPVTLTAAQSGGSIFAGWACTGNNCSSCTGTGQCQLTMNSDISVTATFNPMPPNDEKIVVKVVRDGTGVPIYDTNKNDNFFVGATQYNFTFDHGTYTNTANYTDVNVNVTYSASLFLFDEFEAAYQLVSVNPISCNEGQLVNGGTCTIEARYVPRIVNNAQCIFSNAPDNVTTGETFSATVRMKNTGTKTWRGGMTPHRLASVRPNNNTTWGINRVDITPPIAPNEAYTFTINATAPTSTGVKDFYWQMLEEYVESFGDECGESITVTSPAPTLNLTADAYSVPYNGSTTLRWTTTNATSCWASGDWTGWKTNTGGSEGTGALTSTKTYNMECWNSVGATTGIKSVTVTVGAASNNSSCAWVTAPPASVNQGQAFTAKLRMTNTGSTTWKYNGSNLYNLISYKSSTNSYNGAYWGSGTSDILMNSNVSPGGSYEFTINAVAPATATGSQEFDWRMIQQSVEYFGETCMADITVNVPPPPSTYALSVNKSGTGTGTVTSSDSKINCGSDCSESGYSSGTPVTLTAAQSGGSIFTGWDCAGNDCSQCTGTGQCKVTMNTNINVTATFNQSGSDNETVNVQLMDINTNSILPYNEINRQANFGFGVDYITFTNGVGSVSRDFTSGTAFIVYWDPPASMNISGKLYTNTGALGWCNLPNKGSCTIYIYYKAAPSTFDLSVSKAGSGSGTVTSSDSKINCGSDCSESGYSSGTSVTLTAAQSSGSTFAGWACAGNDCSQCTGTGQCQVTMNTNINVTATFNATPGSETVNVKLLDASTFQTLPYNETNRQANFGYGVDYISFINGVGSVNRDFTSSTAFIVYWDPPASMTISGMLYTNTGALGWCNLADEGSCTLYIYYTPSIIGGTNETIEVVLRNTENLSGVAYSGSVTLVVNGTRYVSAPFILDGGQSLSNNIGDYVPSFNTWGVLIADDDFDGEPDLNASLPGFSYNSIDYSLCAGGWLNDGGNCHIQIWYTPSTPGDCGPATASPYCNAPSGASTLCDSLFGNTAVIDSGDWWTWTCKGSQPSGDVPCQTVDQDPDCSCAADTCVGDTCPDGCGGTCDGTKACAKPGNPIEIRSP